MTYMIITILLFNDPNDGYLIKITHLMTQLKKQLFCFVYGFIL